MTFTYRHTVRYLEVDAQNVVFNSWYLGWFDDAMSAFLEYGGLPYKEMVAAGYDVQLVRTEIDWRAGVGFQDIIDIAVSTARLGRTSFCAGLRGPARVDRHVRGPHRLRRDRRGRLGQARDPAGDPRGAGRARPAAARLSETPREIPQRSRCSVRLSCTGVSAWTWQCGRVPDACARPGPSRAYRTRPGSTACAVLPSSPCSPTTSTSPGAAAASSASRSSSR